MTATLTAAFNALKADLTTAWELRNFTFEGEETNPVKRALNSSNFINAIDPENMGRLQLFFKQYAKGTDTLASFAAKIIDGKLAF
jgi:hypothetical protein